MLQRFINFVFVCISMHEQNGAGIVSYVINQRSAKAVKSSGIPGEGIKFYISVSEYYQSLS